MTNEFCRIWGADQQSGKVLIFIIIAGLVTGDRTACCTSPRRRRWQETASGTVLGAAVREMLRSASSSGAYHPSCSSSWRGSSTVCVLNVDWWTEVPCCRVVVARIGWRQRQNISSSSVCVSVTSLDDSNYNLICLDRLSAADVNDVENFVLISCVQPAKVSFISYVTFSSGYHLWVHHVDCRVLYNEPTVWNSLPDLCNPVVNSEHFQRGLETIYSVDITEN